ncbi:MAG: hypothetical protein ACOX36_07085 [Saccharofermentanales bacterium]|jgi:hypothetical protein
MNGHYAEMLEPSKSRKGTVEHVFIDKRMVTLDKWVKSAGGDPCQM